MGEGGAWGEDRTGRGRPIRGDNTPIILYLHFFDFSLRSFSCCDSKGWIIYNVCHLVGASLSLYLSLFSSSFPLSRGLWLASMQNGVVWTNDIENDRKEIENSFPSEACCVCVRSTVPL